MRKPGCRSKSRTYRTGNLQSSIGRRRRGYRQSALLCGTRTNYVRPGAAANLPKSKPDKPAGARIAAVDPNTCVGCGACEQVCPASAITVNGVARVHADKCLGCGSCVAQCPQEALSLVPAGTANQQAGDPAD